MTRDGPSIALFLSRCLLGSLFIAHLYWKLALFPGGIAGWWSGLIGQGYHPVVPAYVLSAELAGALLLLPGIYARFAALYALPMMIGAAQFWLVRTGFYFTKSGAELPIVWAALLCIQAIGGDGAYALVPSRTRQRSSTNRP